MIAKSDFLIGDPEEQIKYDYVKQYKKKSNMGQWSSIQVIFLQRQQTITDNCHKHFLPKTVSRCWTLPYNFIEIKAWSWPYWKFFSLINPTIFYKLWFKEELANLSIFQLPSFPNSEDPNYRHWNRKITKITYLEFFLPSLKKVPLWVTWLGMRKEKCII